MYLLLESKYPLRRYSLGVLVKTTAWAHVGDCGFKSDCAYFSSALPRTVVSRVSNYYCDETLKCER